MRIGLDIDNVISNFDEVLLKAYIKHDEEIGGPGIVNDSPKVRCKFNWTSEEEKKFYKNNLEKIAQDFEPIPEASKYIKMLRDKGYEIYIISGRDNGEYSNPRKMTEEWLAKYDIPYDKLFLTNAYNVHDKTEICLKNNIPILIDDSLKNCIDAYKFGLYPIIMDMPFNRDNDYIKRAHSWEEIYDIVCNYGKSKYKVILDTDTYNESDDQFAIAYMFKSLDIFDVEAITIAPFRKETRFYDDSGIENSYKEARKICDLLGLKSFDRIFRGSTNYMLNGYSERNEAVDKIIDFALKNEKTYIMAIGAITNVALAIKYEPKIIDRIEIIWLGGHNFFYPNNLHEANFKDVDAVKEIFSSDVKLTIIPCKGVASNLETTVYELEHKMDINNPLHKYLIDGFDYYTKTYQHRDRWPIWDIAVIAYMINPRWFVRKVVDVPMINKDLAYEGNYENRKADMVVYLSSYQIYDDLFRKLGGENDSKE